MITPLIGGLGWTEILVIAGVIFVLFGASRIPAAFRSLGEGINSFKEGLEGDKDGEKSAKALPEKSSGGENESISVKQS
jgi:sec-independent protein translocase protein TatA